MSLPENHIELLSPARDLSIGREAILHGADAVYIGGPSFGARHSAHNSVSDIARLVEFAQIYNVKIFTTLNTILHDNELDAAQKLIYQLYDAGVSALIIQDMGILKLDIPPIDLHASTQCDIRNPAKAAFLANVGFSQLVLARELDLTQIKQISAVTAATLEFFIHGALCVAYSGQCYISHAQTGRSANRGDCSQACRLPYTLKDSSGAVVAFEQHLLSMKDNNQSANLLHLINAGVQSFKIEGRYKDLNYVKNITAFYHQQLDLIMENKQHNNIEFKRTSTGTTTHYFIPNPDKTFHRGNTDYFVNERHGDIGAFESPKFVGLPIGELTGVFKDHLRIKTNAPLVNGDGLNLLIKREVFGFRASTVVEIAALDYRVYPNEMLEDFAKLKNGTLVNRNLDHAWDQALNKESALRKIQIKKMLLSEDINAKSLILTLVCESGIKISNFVAINLEIAKNQDHDIQNVSQNIKKSLAKLGQTDFFLENIDTDILLELSQKWFIPNAVINQLRRDAIASLTAARIKAHKDARETRKIIPNLAVVYPEVSLTYLANVYNHKAREFYADYGVKLIDNAYESHEEKSEVPVMITKHCLRFSFNLCPKQAKGVTGVMGQIRAEPMQLIHNDEIINLKFNCRACEMQVMGKIKPHILRQALAGS
ncbi:peptidase [Gammaproteobacteria bacterium]|nr:peptidase [Gammaproteobacteria bacterium]